MSFAVIRTGGKQYKVKASEILKVEKLESSKPESKIEFKEILAYGDDKNIEVGLPLVQGAKVEAELIKKENDCGLSIISEYGKFSKRVNDIKLKIYDFFISAKQDGKKVVCYGAPAKGNTMLNFCGIGRDLVEYLSLIHIGACGEIERCSLRGRRIT